MSKQIHCTACNTHFGISSQLFDKHFAGKMATVKCRKCGTHIEVDSRQAKLPAAAVNPSAPAAPHTSASTLDKTMPLPTPASSQSSQQRAASSSSDDPTKPEIPISIRSPRSASSQALKALGPKGLQAPHGPNSIKPMPQVGLVRGPSTAPLSNRANHATRKSLRAALSEHSSPSQRPKRPKPKLPPNPTPARDLPPPKGSPSKFKGTMLGLQAPAGPPAPTRQPAFLAGTMVGVAPPAAGSALQPKPEAVDDLSVIAELPPMPSGAPLGLSTKMSPAVGSPVTLATGPSPEGAPEPATLPFDGRPAESDEPSTEPFDGRADDLGSQSTPDDSKLPGLDRLEPSPVVSITPPAPKPEPAEALQSPPSVIVSAELEPATTSSPAPVMESENTTAELQDRFTAKTSMELEILPSVPPAAPLPLAEQSEAQATASSSFDHGFVAPRQASRQKTRRLRSVLLSAAFVLLSGSGAFIFWSQNADTRQAHSAASAPPAPLKQVTEITPPVVPEETSTDTGSDSNVLAPMGPPEAPADEDSSEAEVPSEESENPAEVSAGNDDEQALPNDETVEYASIPASANPQHVTYVVKLAIKRARKCHLGGRATGSAEVFITFSSDGKVSDSHIIGEPIASAPVSRCILRNVNAIKLRKFNAEPFTVSETIVLR